MGRKLGGGSLVIKAVFVLAENDFRKSFYMKPWVWLRMENRVFRKIIYFDRKIAPLTWKIFSASVLPSNHFWRHAKREREREREKGLTDAQTERERERSGRQVWDRTGQITILVPSTRRWDRATNPRTDRPTSSTGEITPRTHEPIAVLVPSTWWWDRATNPRTHKLIDPPRPLTRSRHEPMNQSTHPSSSPMNPRTDRGTIRLVILIFFVLIFVSCVVYMLQLSVIIFVWILRKCEKHDKNGFSIAFLAKQPNTRKYFSKYF